MAVGKKEMTLAFKVVADKAKKNIKEVGDGLKKVGTSSKVAQKGLGFMSKGFKGIGVAMKAAGIGLFIGLLGQLTGMFQSNQKTADTFGRIMLKLKPIFQSIGDVIAFVAGVLEGLIDMFSSAISWLGSLIGITDDTADATAGYAEDIVRLRKEVKLMNAELALTQLQYQKEAELQRQIRDDTSKTIDERINANNKLARILERQAQEEQEKALVALELAEKELALERDNADLQVAVIDAKTKLAEIDERITSQRSEQLTNLNSLEQERVDIEKEQSEKRAARLDELLALQNKDLEVKKDITNSIKDQLKASKDAHGEIMSMYREELAMEVMLLKEAEARRLTELEEQKRALQILGKTTKILSGVDTTEMLAKQGQQDAKMQKVIEESNQKILDLEKEYNQLMGDASQEYYQTEEQLILQAAKKLDEHFETAKEKELRETEEKYATLFGYAENDAERTIELEKEKALVLSEIRNREGKNMIQDTIELFEKLKLEKEKKDEEDKLDNDKKAEEQAARNRKTVDNAIGMMNALLSISKTKSEKEKKQLDKDLAKGLITEKQYNKKLQKIEEEQLRKEKQAALIQIGVDTARGISGAVQAGAGLIFPANLAAISTGILAVLAGVAQAAGVMGQTVDAGSSDMPDDNTSDLGESDLGGAVPSLPTFGAIESDAPPIQAYVVESDVSGAQALQSELDLQSTL